MRILLIAALFHDFDHSGHPHPGEEDPDAINIKNAIAGLRRYVTLADRHDLDGRYTVFGHIIAGADVPARLQRGDLILRVYVRE